jgi:hypothetical protein
MQTVTIPFGKHKDQPLPDVPSSYLSWLLGAVKLSSGLRAAVAGELERRGMVPRPAPPPAPPSPCPRCGWWKMRHAWMENSRGQRMLRRECGRCRSFCGFAPQVEPFITEANAAASPTAILDVLTRLDDLGVQLGSDGASVWFTGEGARRVTPDLEAVVRQCNHRLAKLLGRTRPGRGIGDSGREWSRVAVLAETRTG